MTNAYIAIIGLDADKKRRAGKFKAKDLAAVQKAADAMNMFVAIPKSEDAVKVLAKLADGKLLANGKAIVPVHRGKWDPLLDTFIPLPNMPVTDPPAANQPTLWPDLKIGAVVIAPEILPSENGWWRAEIIGVSPDKKSLTLKWLDAPRQAPTTMPREQVAILHPKF